MSDNDGEDLREFTCDACGEAPALEGELLCAACDALLDSAPTTIPAEFEEDTVE